MSLTKKEWLSNIVIDHPWKTLMVVFIMFGLFAQNIIHVRPSVSYQDLLGKDHPKLIDYEYIQGEYTRDDNLLVLFEAKKGNAFEQSTLLAMRDLTNQLWKTPYSIRVDSITNFQHSYAIGDELIVNNLFSIDKDIKQRTPKAISSIAKHEPLLLNRATNVKGNVIAASVSFAFPNKDASEKLEAYAYVMDLKQKYEITNPSLNIYVSGLVALDATVMKIAERETGLFLILIIGVVIILLTLFMRALTPVLVSIVVCILSIVMALALSGFMGWKLTPFTASVPLMILIIAVADCVHLVANYRHELGLKIEKTIALKNALKNNLGPIAITSITTAIGFMTLNFSESDSIHALGNEVAFGVLAAFATGERSRADCIDNDAIGFTIFREILFGVIDYMIGAQRSH